jgi:predicted enzyme related to lactoylglutathione lyase
MARVLGVGGVFFKASAPASLASWYATHLGIEMHPAFSGTVFKPQDQPQGGYTVWSAFERDTKYFEPSTQDYMVNLIVDDLAAALAQVKSGGATLHGEPQELEFGLFGWFSDPEGNKVELWQPNPDGPT